MRAELSTKVGDVRVLLSQDVEKEFDLYAFFSLFHKMIDHEAVLSEVDDEEATSTKTIRPLAPPQ